MTKILNKKHSVYDFELTNYGKYLLSIGHYKPTYYAFYDDNIVYDNRYNNISESQNSINERIKNETPYIGTLTLFEDIDSTGQTLVENIGFNRGVTGMSEIIQDGATSYYLSDITPIRYRPRKDIFRFDSALGDAMHDSKEKDVMPAWKIVVLNGKITSTSTKYELTGKLTSSIPQVNITVDYRKEIREARHPTRQSDQVGPESIRGAMNSTANFADQNFIYLTSQDPIVYIDEVNTELLAENYDVEMFVVTSSGPNQPEDLTRKFFENVDKQIVDGLMTRPNPRPDFVGKYPETAVEYYFDFKTDQMADKDIVCKSLEEYNKSSYYIDIDLDCEPASDADVYNDIYGSTVEPEICLD